jgi:hypothetical protein
MACTTHDTMCAFQEAEDDVRCPFCHVTWTKITYPSTETRVSKGYSRKTGQTVFTEEIRHLGGYGEHPGEHIAKHVTTSWRHEKSTKKVKETA